MELPKLGLASLIKGNGKDDGVQAFAEELRKLAELSITKSGDPLEMDRINQRIKAIKGGLDKKDHSRIDDIYNGYSAAGLAGVTNMTDDSGREILKDIATTNLALGALETGTGILQAIRGHAEKKKLTPPTFPTDLSKNAGLQNRINQVQLKATEGDTQLRDFFKDNLAENDAVNLARAKNTGGIGQFTANAQANRVSSDKALKAFSAQEDLRKTAAGTELSQLIRQDVNEDFRLQRLQTDKFNVQNKAYSNSLVSSQSQINSGLGNAFTGAANVAEALPFFKNSRPAQGVPASLPDLPTSTAPTAPGGMNQPVGAVNQMAPIDQFANQPSFGEFISLGNTGNRTPQSILKFQDFAATELGLEGYSEGVFDHLTEEAYNKFYYNRY